MKFKLNYLIAFRTVFVCLLVLYYSSVSNARGQYLDQWETTYPQSTSSDSGCQLCHQSAGGGNGWNQYGWAIRPIFLDIRMSNGGDDVAALARALEDVENNFNPDFSSGDGPNFLDEIRYNVQPGWLDGAVNTINFRELPTVSNQLPPTYSPVSQTENDLAVTVVANPVTDPLTPDTTLIEFHQVANQLNAPVKAVQAPGINGSLFVVEQRGKIVRVDLSNGQKTVFHDVSNQLVAPRSGFDERGLLSLAFHPNFATNGLFYTYQSEPVRAAQTADFTTLPSPDFVDHRSMIVEYRASDASCNSPIAKQRTLLVVDQPEFNHNGGDLSFGPDGYLYVSFGDGGGRDDQASSGLLGAPQIGHGLLGNGRDNTNPLGAILRIDVAGTNSSNGEYGIPASNPFTAANDDGLDEIYAYGFRNPYRFSFDSLCFQSGQSCNTLITADVGQDKVEEIDSVVSGGNYGWNWKEGGFFFIDRSNENAFVTSDEPPGVPNDLIDPIGQYGRTIGISVTGGYVYRGSALSALAGKYLFADFFRGGSNRDLMSLDPNQTLDTQTIREFTTNVSGNITGFGEDSEKELYIVTNGSFGNPLNAEGTLQKIIPLGASYLSPDQGQESAMCPPSEELCVPVKSANGSIAVICI